MPSNPISTKKVNSNVNQISQHQLSNPTVITTHNPTKANIKIIQRRIKHIHQNQKTNQSQIANQTHNKQQINAILKHKQRNQPGKHNSNKQTHLQTTQTRQQQNPQRNLNQQIIYQKSPSNNSSNENIQPNFKALLKSK